MSRNIFITEHDLEKLQKLVNSAKEFSSIDKRHLTDLEFELSRASVVAPTAIPGDVITMNSQVMLRDLESDEELVYTLVYPQDANLPQNKISVLAPIGTAMLGYRTGSVIDWAVPGGVIKLKVEKIMYQPEASGNFEL